MSAILLFVVAFIVLVGFAYTTARQRARRPVQAEIALRTAIDYFDPTWKTISVVVNADPARVAFHTLALPAAAVNRDSSGSPFIILTFRNPTDSGDLIWCFNTAAARQAQIGSRSLPAIRFRQSETATLRHAVEGLGDPGDSITVQTLPASDMIPVGDYRIWLDLVPDGAKEGLRFSLNSLPSGRVPDVMQVHRMMLGRDRGIS